MSQRNGHSVSSTSPLHWVGKKAPFPTLDPATQSDQMLQQAAGALASVGIAVRTPSLEQVQRGVLLARALAARTHHFIRSDDPLSVEPEALLFPQSVHGSPVVQGWEWDALQSTWGLFEAVPGIAIEVPDGVEAWEYLWCAGELYQLLTAWGAKYIELAGAEAEPIKVHYTGRRFGGPVMRRRDMSQIGLSAAITLPEANAEEAIEALWQVNPDYRVRTQEDRGTHFNHMHAKANMATDVLEPNPEVERLLLRPASVRDVLQRDPEFFEPYDAKRFAAAFVGALPLMSDAAVMSVFDAFTDHEIPASVLLEVAIAQKAEGLLLTKLSTQGKQLLTEILRVDPATAPNILKQLDEQLKVLVLFHSVQGILDKLPKDWSKVSGNDLGALAEIAESLKALVEVVTDTPEIWELLQRFVGELDIMALIGGEFTPSEPI